MWNASDVQKTPTISWHEECTFIKIYRRIITVDIDRIIKKTIQYRSPPAATYMRPEAGLSIYNPCTSSLGQVGGLWFSSRKCKLYKLGTQDNLATDIKSTWGILEKWQRTRSAFSKLCLAFFLRKTPPYLNCIVLQLRYQTCWKPLQVTATFFIEPNIQPSVRFRIFRSSFSKMPSSLDVSPLNSRPGQPTRL